MINIIKKEWCPEQALYLYDAIADDIADADNLPVAKAVGSSVICADGKIYFLFPDSTWKPLSK